MGPRAAASRPDRDDLAAASRPARAACAGEELVTGEELAAPCVALVQRFARRRPLRAGSLLVTIFGDAVMPRGGSITLQSLIELARPFAIKERLVRTAAARLAQEGWLETRRLGKRSEYRLSRSGRERFIEATHRIYGPAPAWSGRWTLLLAPRLPGARRERLHRELVWLGFGAIDGTLYAHPGLDRNELEHALAPRSPARAALTFEATLTAGAAGALLERGWDLTQLARGYRRLVAGFAPVRSLAHEIARDPRSAFVLRTLLIHDYRRVHLRDPMLPAELLPAEWPGFEAAALCRALYGRLLGASEAFIDATARRLEGPLPPADGALVQRFCAETPIKPTAPGSAPDRS